MIISKSLSNNGYNMHIYLFIRILLDLISLGYSDLTIQIRNGEMLQSIKSIMCYSNKKFREIIEDPKFDNTLCLNENINKESVILLFQYYGGGKIKITDDNIQNLLLFCLYYNENELLVELKKYCASHLDEEIVIYLLNHVEIVEMEILKDLKNNFEIFLKENVYLLLENVNKLNIDGIKYILSTKHLSIKNENEILNSVLKYYKIYKNEIESIKVLFIQLNSE